MNPMAKVSISSIPLSVVAGTSGEVAQNVYSLDSQIVYNPRHHNLDDLAS